jgi:hypothetical protein
MIEQTQKNTGHPNRDLERMNYMLRADLLFDNHDHVSSVTGNACGKGLFCLHGSRLLAEHHIGEEGTCQIFIGKEHFNIPFKVVRSEQMGLAVKLHDGDNLQFQQVFRRIAREDAFYEG